jgi:hypothetical protein
MMDPEGGVSLLSRLDITLLKSSYPLDNLVESL